MLYNYNKLAASICPYCSTVSQRTISIFDFSGKHTLEIICPIDGCKEKIAVVRPRNNKKYNITIECPICGEEHSFLISEEKLWKKDILTFKCSASGIDIFFLGEPDKVRQKVDESIKIYRELMSEYDGGVDEFDIINEILKMIKALSQAHLLRCTCGSEDIKFSLHEDTIELRCVDCGRAKILHADENSLMYLMNSDGVILT